MSESGRFTAETKAFGAGTWSTAREAGIAYDRVVLFLKLDKPLNFPKESKRLGPASPDEMKFAARMAGAAEAKSTLRSGFLGVTRIASGNYQAHPVARVRAGVWKRVEDAALARDRVILHLGLPYGLNFPEKALALGPASAEQMKQAASRALRGPHRYRGTEYNESSGKWSARLEADGNRYYIGLFSSPEKAARAYDEAAWNLMGNSAILNFSPPPHPPTCTPPPSRSLPKTSRYRGVVKVARLNNKYAVRLVVKGTKFSVGMFVSEEDAAEAYDRLCLHVGLSRDELNFPDRKLEPASSKELREEARRAFKETTTSQYRGVTWSMGTERWRATIRSDNQTTELGYFDSEEEAALAYDRAAMSVHERPVLNFPEDAKRPRRKRRP